MKTSYLELTIYLGDDNKPEECDCDNVDLCLECKQYNTGKCNMIVGIAKDYCKKCYSENNEKCIFDVCPVSKLQKLGVLK